MKEKTKWYEISNKIDVLLFYLYERNEETTMKLFENLVEMVEAQKGIEYKKGQYKEREF